MIFNRKELNRKSATKCRAKKKAEFDRMKEDIVELTRSNASLREHLNSLTVKLFDQTEKNKALVSKMGQDKNQQTMFLTSLLLANSNGKSDQTRAKQLIRSKITTAIQNQEQNMYDQNYDALPINPQLNFNSNLTMHYQAISEPQRIKSSEIQRNDMILGFAQSKHMKSVGFQ